MKYSVLALMMVAVCFAFSIAAKAQNDLLESKLFVTSKGFKSIHPPKGWIPEVPVEDEQGTAVFFKSPDLPIVLQVGSSRKEQNTAQSLTDRLATLYGPDTVAKGKILGQKDIVLAGQPGREITIQLPQGVIQSLAMCDTVWCYELSTHVPSELWAQYSPVINAAFLSFQKE